ncbi:hypothetical protein EB796_010951 [Bugula neritina]|uniref:Uncharacterized protein n=1 Tax=Bugula neritina TaxID=10212 RepID=A0A7J7JWH5_BUGNE|nr:hypothetical protein EB796_010951 [Bugula neritina]
MNPLECKVRKPISVMNRVQSGCWEIQSQHDLLTFPQPNNLSEDTVDREAVDIPQVITENLFTALYFRKPFHH